MKRIELQCKRCGKIWTPRKEKRPCPRCKHMDWNKPKSDKSRGVVTARDLLKSERIYSILLLLRVYNLTSRKVTQTELGHELGITQVAIQHHLTDLRKKGYICRGTKYKIDFSAFVPDILDHIKEQVTTKLLLQEVPQDKERESLKEKLIKNALIAEKLYKLTPEEKKEAITELLETHTQRGLAKELGIPHSTIHDWASGRQKNSGNDVHISLNNFYRKIVNSSPQEIRDWGRLELIKERIEELLRWRQK